VDIVLGIGIAALAGQMFRGHTKVRLPKRVVALRLPRDAARRVLGLLASFYTVGGRWTKARAGQVTHGANGLLVATTVALMAAVIMLPIPLGDVLPALSLIVLGLGLVFCDGAAVLLAFATACVAMLLNLAIVVTLWRCGLAWLVGWN
jgi:hypothetical protein